MFTNIANKSKRFLMALGVLALGLSVTAAAGDSANAYSRFGDHDTIALIDAVNRDHPVGRSHDGGVAMNLSMKYGSKNDMAAINELDRRAPSVSAAAPVAANPYLSYQDSDYMALIDAINRDSVAHASAPIRTPSYSEAYRQPAVQFVGSEPSYAQSSSFEPRG